MMENKLYMILTLQHRGIGRMPLFKKFICELGWEESTISMDKDNGKLVKLWCYFSTS